ncbi:MAG: MFS transporter [Alphaproteobacteria bacterium]|nr:MFS transporter [Alphaproteobacteria bacterium]
MRNVSLRLALAQGAAGSIGGMYTPFFGAWLAWRGLTPDAIGALLAAGMLLRVVVAPLSGMVADARNDRRGAMLVLYAVVFLGYAALNGTRAPEAIFLAAVAANVAGGSATPLLESVSVRLSEVFDFDYGHVRVWASATFMAGNVVAGVCVSRFGLAALAPWLTISAALNLIAIWALPAPPANRARGDFALSFRATLGEARELLRSRIFVVFLAAASLDQGSHAFYYSLGGLHWRTLGYSGTLIGLLWPLGVLAEIGLMAVSLKVFRALGATRLLMLGAACCMLRWTILAFDPPLPVVVFAQFLHGGTFALAHLGAMYFVLRAVPPRLAATAQSLYAVASSGLALGLATLAVGPLYAAYGGRAYLLMSAMGLVSLGLGYVLRRSWHGGRLSQGAEEEVLATI